MAAFATAPVARATINATMSPRACHTSEGLSTRQCVPTISALNALRQQHLQQLAAQGVQVRTWAPTTPRRGEAGTETDQLQHTYRSAIVKLPELKTWDCPIETAHLTVLKTRSSSPIKTLVHNPYSFTGPLKVVDDSPRCSTPVRDSSSDSASEASFGPICTLSSSPGSRPLSQDTLSS
eukprot:GGOE01009658.1.p4 GENE.GGOE01009658.1~~GGOE01009658.1.p4  ORF type:complete len:188 (-),score=5.68 GGOE01009658.1:2032-2568(-)